VMHLADLCLVLEAWRCFTALVSVLLHHNLDMTG
jgi:hypothetical protein